MNSDDLASGRPRGAIWKELARLYEAAPRKRRRQFYALLALMLVGTLAELATIGAVVPFIASLASR